MKRHFLFSVAFVWLGLLAPVEARGNDAPASGLKRFGWFAEVVGGSWVGTFPDGKTTHTQTYTTQFGVFIRGEALLKGEHNGQITDTFRGDSLFAINADTGKMDYFIWGSDGSYSRQEAFYEGDELVFPVFSKKEPTVVAWRSVWKRLGADALEVRREKREGDQWKTTLVVRYERKPSAAK